ncbi:hypothetical protein [Aneurinibacillus aneurinilyticus]|jgi:hypothetical protein|uniref:hypothetical protein n=1 Tax=Aneurinibacillus aneurinilyticus TaxID=1391 RepID=UPI0023F7AB62|nr:hypothetical protein [Aneurinibacillus aneurinilyticus]MCI1693313.1 hypothetical protein [Aneurinibacillus aneurinilyticus]
MMKHLDKVILDADICFKLGRYSKVQVLQQVIPHIANEVYIHEYVYAEEIKKRENGKDQLEQLIALKQLTVLYEQDLSTYQKHIYDGIVSLLCQVMKGTPPYKDKKHLGEIFSLAMAKTLQIPIFMTDERDLQPIIDSKLNSGMSDDISVFRLRSLIFWIKEHPECGISRKEAKFIWCGAYSKDDLDYYKAEFDNKIWPL